MRRAFLVLPLAAALAGAACGDGAAVTPTSATPEAAVEAAMRLFTGTLSPGGTAFFSFSVPQASGVSLTLASLTPTTERAASPARLTLGLGVPRGTGCALTTSATVGADLAAQVREWRPGGILCASIGDAGELTGDVAFAVRIGYFQ